MAAERAGVAVARAEGRDGVAAGVVMGCDGPLPALREGMVEDPVGVGRVSLSPRASGPRRLSGAEGPRLFSRQQTLDHHQRLLPPSSAASLATPKGVVSLRLPSRIRDDPRPPGRWPPSPIDLFPSPSVSTRSPARSLSHHGRLFPLPLLGPPCHCRPVLDQLQLLHLPSESNPSPPPRQTRRFPGLLGGAVPPRPRPEWRCPSDGQIRPHERLHARSYCQGEERERKESTLSSSSDVLTRRRARSPFACLSRLVASVLRPSSAGHDRLPAGSP